MYVHGCIYKYSVLCPVCVLIVFGSVCAHLSVKIVHVVLVLGKFDE